MTAAPVGRDTLKLGVVRVILAMQNAVLAGVVRLLFRRRRADAPPPARLVVYRTARLGDFIVALPALAEIRARFPAARIALVTTPSTDPVNAPSVAKSLQGSIDLPWTRFAHPRYVDSVITFQRGSDSDWMPRLRAELQAFAPDEIIFLGTTLESWRSKLKKLLFFAALGMRKPIFGWRVSALRKPFLDAQWRAKMLEHQVVACIRSIAEHPLLRSVDFDKARMTIEGTAPSRATADGVLTHIAANATPIAVFPGGTFDHKRWPADRFAELCTKLGAVVPNANFVFVGGSSDRDAIAQVRSLTSVPAIDLSGRLDLAELAAVLERCALYVGNDSGPTHLASAVGCPTVSIISGIEYPGAWEPWEHRSFAVRHSVPCEGCYGFYGCATRTQACLRDLPVDRVFDACISALNAETRVHQVVAPIETSPPALNGMRSGA